MKPDEALMTLLRTERAAILSGDLTHLADTAGRKEALIEELEAAPPATLAAIRREAQEVLSLLDASRRGIAAARARLAEQEEARAGLSIYGPEGRNRTVGGPAPKVGGRF